MDGGLTYNPADSSRVAVFDSSKLLTTSSVTTTELSYLSGVTSAVQTQIDTKVKKPIYGTGNPNALGTVGTDGQAYNNTDTGQQWTYWVGYGWQ